MNAKRAGAHEVLVIAPGLVRIRFEPLSERSVNPDLNPAPAPCACEVREGRENTEWVFDGWRLRIAHRAGGPLAGIELEMAGEPGSGRSLTEPDRSNLGGVRYSLDACDGWLDVGYRRPLEEARPFRLPDGILSRRGWALAGATEDNLSVKDAAQAREWYLFVYGRDYPSAIRNLFRLAGKPPLLPRWTLGTWFSRFQPLTPEDYRDIARGFRERGMGLDVIVCDMNWHSDNWYSLRYNTDRFPDMPGFLNWAREENLRVVFNHHPGGLEREDPRLGAFLRATGLRDEAAREEQDAKQGEGKDAFHFDYRNPAFFQTYWDIFLQPLVNDGVAAHWVDGTPETAGMKLYRETARRSRPGERAVVLTRPQTGTLLAHRYPIAFSGDTFITWGSLRATVGMTLAGASHGVMWSHDIGGHMRGTADEELFCRWMQAGVFSHIFRLHSGGGRTVNNSPELIRRPWLRGERADAVARRFIPLRYALLPYIETALRRQHDEGIPLTRPLYLEHPEREEAYRFGEDEYYFGPDLLVAPILDAGADGIAERELWLPPGQWMDWFTGERWDGDRIVTARKPVLELPLFVRVGAPIPMNNPGMCVPEAGGPSERRLLVAEAAADMRGRSRLYEDDGETDGYIRGECRWTDFGYERSGGEHRLTIGMPVGHFPGAPAETAWTAVFRGTGPAGCVEEHVPATRSVTEGFCLSAARRHDPAGTAGRGR